MGTYSQQKAPWYNRSRWARRQKWRSPEGCLTQGLTNRLIKKTGHVRGSLNGWQQRAKFILLGSGQWRAKKENLRRIQLLLQQRWNWLLPSRSSRFSGLEGREVISQGREASWATLAGLSEIFYAHL